MNKKRYRFNLRAKLITGFSLLSLSVSGLSTGAFYTYQVERMIEEFRSRALSIVRLASLQQDGDEFVLITSAADELYETYRLRNLAIRYSDPDIIYVYTLRKQEQGIYFIVDAGELGEEDIAPYGALYEEPSPTLVENFDTMETAIADEEVYTDEYGSFLSAYAPIFTGNGQKVGIIAVDILAETIVSRQRQILTQSVLIMAFATLLGVIMGALAGNYFSGPIRKLAEGTETIAKGNFTARVQIASRDEVGELGSAFNDMAAQLQNLVTNLESLVAERTSALEESNLQVQKRAGQLQAISDIIKSIASLQKVEKLLPLIADSISQLLDLYHVGIFLLDERGDYAVLSASNSEGGRRMLQRKHMLRVGQEGIVGYVAAQRKSRVALDVGDDAVYFDNIDLPETRSEAAMPLISGNQILGVLDVQSRKPNAFSSEDIDILETLANQVTLAIDNSRLFQQSQQALADLDAILQRYIRTEWRQFVASTDVKGYRSSDKGAEPISTLGLEPIPTKDDSGTYRVPVTLRGVNIGSLEIKGGEHKQAYSQEEKDIIRAAAERVALALENARLLAESQKRAAKERTIGEISSKIGASVNLRNVLQTAVEELGRALGEHEVVIQISSHETKGGQNG
ncbi:MAG: GAF domain-containing protein [Chloroflexota bacterium]